MNVQRALLSAALVAATAFSWSGLAAQAQDQLRSPAGGPGVSLFPVQGQVSLLVGPGGLGSASANITVQTSDDAIVLVDTGRGDAADRTIAALREVSTRPVRFIINTQAAPDHTGGNEALARSGRPYGGRAAGAGFLLADQSAGATIIAHENVLLTLGGARGGAAAPFGVLPSETYFTPEHELFNGEAIRLLHAPAAHSDGDSLVFFRRSDVISTGDVFSTLTYPRIDPKAGATINGAINALNLIIDLAIPRDKQEGGTYIIPGHGRVADEADVVEYRDMVVIIRDRVQDLLTKGRTLDQIKAAQVTFDYDRRYSTPAWTGDQLVEAIVATLPPPPPAPAGRPRRR
jgi:glyoxylase-like metal-dependent hydrolase (beta-lactamase superfamily II)